MGRKRITAPFLIGFVGGVLVALVAAPIAGFFGVDMFLMSDAPLFAGMPVLLVSGPAIGFLAASASLTWRGLLTLVMGFAAAGVALGLFAGYERRPQRGQSRVLHNVCLGFLGVPTYLIAVAAMKVIDRLRRPSLPDRR